MKTKVYKKWNFDLQTDHVYNNKMDLCVFSLNGVKY